MCFGPTEAIVNSQTALLTSPPKRNLQPIVSNTRVVLQLMNMNTTAAENTSDSLPTGQQPFDHELTEGHASQKVHQRRFAITGSRVSLPPLYLNIILLNKDDVVKATVAKKTGISGGLFGKALSAAANKVISDASIINNVSSKLKENIEAAVLKVGITATVSKKFQQGPYVVMKLQIEDVDVMNLLRMVKGEEFAEHFSTLLNSVTALGQGESAIPTLLERVHKQVFDGVKRRLSEAIPQQLEQVGGLHVDFMVATQEDQAEHMFMVLESLGLQK